ncbi:MAG: YbaK/EbsC family protein [Bacteroidetes bacterium]|nr:YbaK/EbsC family protein [Bacteroidota bacterium]
MDSLPPKVALIQKTLHTLGVDFEVRQLDQSTRTAKEASEALGCTIDQIVKSLVFCAGQAPILVLVSGSHRVNETLLSQRIGRSVTPASADFVRQHTGFSIGGVAPLGHPTPIPTYVDEGLMKYEQVWAAAGGPFAVFGCTPAFLCTLGQVVKVT